MAEKNTLSILESIKKKMQKLDEPRDAQNKDFSDIGDEFNYSAPSKKAAQAQAEQDVADEAEAASLAAAAVAPAAQIEVEDEIEREIGNSLRFDEVKKPQSVEVVSKINDIAPKVEAAPPEIKVAPKVEYRQQPQVAAPAAEIYQQPQDQEDVSESDDSFLDEEPANLELEENHQEAFVADDAPAQVEEELFEEEQSLEDHDDLPNLEHDDLNLEHEEHAELDLEHDEHDDLDLEHDEEMEDDLNLEQFDSELEPEAKLEPEAAKEPEEALFAEENQETDELEKELDLAEENIKHKKDFGSLAGGKSAILKSEEDELERLLKEEESRAAKQQNQAAMAVAAQSTSAIGAPAAAASAVLAAANQAQSPANNKTLEQNKKMFSNVDDFLKHSEQAVEPLVHEQAAHEVADSIKRLVDAKNVVSGVTSFSKSEAFADIAAHLMEPRLEKWLNENLPALVEKIVREEIKKIIPKDIN